jgi:SAM-dependent methyltransferase
VLTYAARRGVTVAGGTAEALPFGDGVFDYALVVTTICFVDSPREMLAEARRVLRPGGALVIGFIDRTTEIGQHYEAHRKESAFYRDATFYGASEVEDLLRSAGFLVRGWAQTLFGASPAMQEIEPVRPGVGQGAFVVVHANASADRAQAKSEVSANVGHHASNCRWAMPALFLPAPYWWDAERCPWACVGEAVPRILETTEVCTDCPYWEAHPKAETDAGDSPDATER